MQIWTSCVWSSHNQALQWTGQQAPRTEKEDGMAWTDATPTFHTLFDPFLAKQLA